MKTKNSLLFICLSACSAEISTVERAARSISDFTCTEGEAKRVHAESGFCAKHTGYMSSFCYEAAIKRICTAKETPKCSAPTSKKPSTK